VFKGEARRLPRVFAKSDEASRGARRWLTHPDYPIEISAIAVIP
jgi:hypothetical protein